jgi:ribonuclease G
MIDKVKKLLGLSPRKTGNKLILSVEKLESRVALLENGRLEEYSVERKSSRNIVGSVYKGKVRNIEMGLKAMFVDIGFEKNAFLHFWDAIPAALDSGVEEIDRPANKRPRKRITVKDIPSIYPVGSDVIVQVTKGPIGTKGCRSAIAAASREKSRTRKSASASAGFCANWIFPKASVSLFAPSAKGNGRDILCAT